jgi:hypothetical protein
VTTTIAARTFPALGTFATLLVADPGALDKAHDLLAAELAAVDAACSRFRRDSELSWVNHARGRPVQVSRLFADALAVALDAAALTDGDVDPTCGQSLVRLGYDRDFAQARRHTGPLRQPPMPARGWRRVRTEPAPARRPASGPGSRRNPARPGCDRQGAGRRPGRACPACSRESAPTFSPPRPHERGVNGKPTLVHNVETLAHVALIARRGDRWFRAAGLPSAPGSMLVTVSGAVTRPGVYEIEMGTTAGEVIMLAGGPAEPLQALLTGGYFGTWLPAEAAWRTPMTGL